MYCVKRVHPLNRLNDLTGAEWVYFLKSVEPTAYSTKGAEGFAHKTRSIHPSPKPPQLMRQFVEFFTKEKGAVLDPFMGVGGVLLACSMCGRRAVGVDLSSAYVDTYHKAREELKLSKQKALVGDSANLLKLLPKRAKFDLLLTDPPYGEMLSQKRHGQRKKDTGRAEATPFTDSAHDLGNMSRADFLSALREIIQAGVQRLNPKGHVIVFAKDMQPSGKVHNMLHCAVTEELLKIPELSFRGYKIWHDKTAKLYPFGYPHAFVSNQLHQFALIFRKDNRADKKMTERTFGWVQDPSDLQKLRRVVEVFCPDSEVSREMANSTIPKLIAAKDGRDDMLAAMSRRPLRLSYSAFGRDRFQTPRSSARCDGIIQAAIPGQKRGFISDWPADNFVRWAHALGFISWDEKDDLFQATETGLRLSQTDAESDEEYRVSRRCDAFLSARRPGHQLARRGRRDCVQRERRGPDKV